MKSNTEKFFGQCISASKSYEIIFSYIKGLFNNYNYIYINFAINEKLKFFEKFIDSKIILSNDEKELKHDLSLAHFYLYFLEHDINGKYALIINDIIMLILVKIFS